jgi:hypothetical protein
MDRPGESEGVMMQRKLTAGEKHFLKLIQEGQNCPNGWAPVSVVLVGLVERLPPELVEWDYVGTEGNGRAKLTKQGENLMAAMAWL